MKRISETLFNTKLSILMSHGDGLKLNLDPKKIGSVNVFMAHRNLDLSVTQLTNVLILHRIRLFAGILITLLL